MTKKLCKHVCMSCGEYTEHSHIEWHPDWCCDPFWLNYEEEYIILNME